MERQLSAVKPILLVDDNARDIELTLAALDESCLADRVVVLCDGNEALKYLQSFTERARESYPAVVLLDVKMPKLNGIDLLRCIKTDPNLRSLPVVMLSSSREISDVLECYRLGVNAYVVKPMEYAEFCEAVKIAGRFWATLNESPEAERGMEGCDGSTARR